MVKVFETIDKLEDISSALAQIGLILTSRSLFDVKFCVLKEMENSIDFLVLEPCLAQMKLRNDFKSALYEKICEAPQNKRSDMILDILIETEINLLQLGLSDAAKEMQATKLLVGLEDDAAALNNRQNHDNVLKKGTKSSNVFYLNEHKNRTASA